MNAVKVASYSSLVLATPDGAVLDVMVGILSVVYAALLTYVACAVAFVLYSIKSNVVFPSDDKDISLVDAAE